MLCALRRLLRIGPMPTPISSSNPQIKSPSSVSLTAPAHQQIVSVFVRRVIRNDRIRIPRQQLCSPRPFNKDRFSISSMAAPKRQNLKFKRESIPAKIAQLYVYFPKKKRENSNVGRKINKIKWKGKWIYRCGEMGDEGGGRQEDVAGPGPRWDFLFLSAFPLG